MHWQSIETAPKEHRFCALVWDGNHIHLAIFYKKHHVTGDCDGYWETPGYCPIMISPTHWFSLPNPPLKTQKTQYKHQNYDDIPMPETLADKETSRVVFNTLFKKPPDINEAS